MIDSDLLGFVHDAELVGLQLHADELRLAVSTEDGPREIRLHSVDRLVAMPFLFGNVIYAARIVPVHADLSKCLGGISNELRSAFFEVYGLTPPVIANYHGSLFVLESSLGCELLCAFRGAIEVT